jgi:hypothetical protein
LTVEDINSQKKNTSSETISTPTLGEATKQTFCSYQHFEWKNLKHSKKLIKALVE